MERRPAGLGRIAAMIFLLINFGVIISETVVIDDPRSTIICIANKTLDNVSFEQDIRAGVFTALENSNGVEICVRQACNRRGGDLVFLLGQTCYMVTCYSKTSCKTIKPDGPSVFSASLTPYTWFDAAPVFTDIPKVLEVKENNQPGQIVKNIYGQARSRWNQNASIKYNIIEGTRGGECMEILRLRATDPDSGTNGQVRYFISTGNLNDIFVLDNHGGLNLKRTPTKQMPDFFNLTVFASDHGNPPLVSKPAFVYIKIRRAFGQCPDRLVFPKAVYLADVNESCPVGTEILQVRATVGKCAYKGKINYFLTESRDPQVEEYFFVRHNTGAIMLIRPLDFEFRDRFSFEVAAVDIRTQTNVATVQVRIQVLDVNDKPYFLKRHYKEQITTPLEPGTEITMVRAADMDKGKNKELEYALVSGSGGCFRVNTKTGAISTIKKLNEENLRLFNITVSVMDHGEPPLKAVHLAHVSILVFTSLQSTVIFMETKPTTITIRFNLRYLATNNIAKYGVIVQEYADDEKKFKEDTKKEPTTWYHVNKVTKESHWYQRYITKEIKSNLKIRKTRLLELTIGDEKNCDSKRGDKDYCNGPLQTGAKYRFQLRVYLKSTGPFEVVGFQDSDLSNPHFIAALLSPETSPSADTVYNKEARNNYDAVVYSLVHVIMIAFLSGFYVYM